MDINLSHSSTLISVLHHLYKKLFSFFPVSTILFPVAHKKEAEGQHPCKKVPSVSPQKQTGVAARLPVMIPMKSSSGKSQLTLIQQTKPGRLSVFPSLPCFKFLRAYLQRSQFLLPYQAMLSSIQPAAVRACFSSVYAV